MSNHDQLAALVRQARDEDDALADRDGCLRRAHTAETAGAHLPAEQLLNPLQVRRADPEAGPA